MSKESEELPSGKKVIRTFDDDGGLLSEMHSYGMLDIAVNMEFSNGQKTEETYFVKKRLAGRKRYEKARGGYPDMPPADNALADSTAELIKLAGREKKQKAAANKRRRENPPTEAQLQEAQRQIPFFQAIGSGDLESTRHFLDAGEDPNAIALGFGTTPLYNACQQGFASAENSLAVVRLLLARGADPNKQFDYDSPISGRLDRGLTALMFAATADVAQALLDAGAAVDATDAHGVTPLMHAAGRGGIDVVTLLLQQGANPKAKSKSGTTAADFARSKLEMFSGHAFSGQGGPADQKVKERIEIYQAVVKMLKD